MDLSFRINGYDFGDRILEDVYFDIEVDTLENLQVTSVKVAPDAASYFKQLNQELWLEAAKDSAEDMLEYIRTLTREQRVEVFEYKCPNGTLEI
jgi:hypothetical protein